MPRVLLDDRLLIEDLLGGLTYRRTTKLSTTTYWYYRACRAAVAGAGGHLSGPFGQLNPQLQQRTIAALLQLRTEISLSEPRTVVPIMAEVALRHPKLNLLNLEAVAVASLDSSTVWLSVESAEGLLPSILDAEGITWTVVEIPA